MQNRYRLINSDCILAMQELIREDVQVDLILTDPPYGTINGLGLDGYKNRDISWDSVIPTREMLCCCEKLLRMGGHVSCLVKNHIHHI